MRSLRELDNDFVSKAAPTVARLVDRLTTRGKAPSAATPPPPVQPAPAAPVVTAERAPAKPVRDLDLRQLSSLDERYAARGFLGFLREVPQLLAVIIAVVLVAGALGTVHLLEIRQTAQEQTVTPPSGGGGAGSDPTTIVDDGTLGPAVGDSVPSYVMVSDTSLSAVAKHDATTTRYALVSLSRYETPEQAVQALSGYDVKRVWVRVRDAGSDAPSMPIEISGNLLTTLAKAYTSTSQVQAAAAAKYQKLADTTTDDPQFKDFYTHYATISREQALAFEHDCPCVYSAIVQATGAKLASLRTRPFVRAVQAAATTVDLKSVDVTTLLPEVLGIVPQPQPPVDPP